MARISQALLNVLDNGMYIPVSKNFAIRRYAFPKDSDVQKKLCESMKEVYRSAFQNQLPAYPFLHGDHASLSNRLVCLLYERANKQQPVGFNASYLTRGCGESIFHVGVTIVNEAQRGKGGMSKFYGVNLLLFLLMHGSNHIFTGLTSNSSMLPLMEKYGNDYYPDWRNPDLKPKKWQLDVAKFLLANHAQDHALGHMAYLDEDTLVVKCYSKGDGSVKMYEKNMQSRNPILRKFMEDRIDILDGDSQYFIFRPKPLPMWILGAVS